MFNKKVLNAEFSSVIVASITGVPDALIMNDSQNKGFKQGLTTRTGSKQ
jgi:hypothetical protein